MMVKFDQSYYQKTVQDFGYDPFDFKPLDFRLGGIDSVTMARKWLCHHEGDSFAENLSQGKPGIVTSGIGLSGVPHVGTLSQIMRAVFLQKNGINVQFVLGDLDSYNARGQSLDRVRERAIQYREFILALGFDEKRGILRTQYEHLDVLLTAYLVSNCLRDKDFTEAEEDLSKLYIEQGAYEGIDFPVKMSILLMTGDFIDLGKNKGFPNVAVMLGLEEHLYVRLAKKVVTRMGMPMRMSALYSRIIRGFNGFPKMSKSIPGSALTMDMSADQISSLILDGEGEYSTPEDSVVFQMMCAVSSCSPSELERLSTECAEKGGAWVKAKHGYADQLIDICRRWPK